MSYYEEVSEAAEYLRARVGEAPAVAVVLGSGLGEFAESIAGPQHIHYSRIPYWPASAVVGHAGMLVTGEAGGKRVAALAGRAHYYEGHDLRRATFGVRVLGLLGVRTLILTNAAGGINTSFEQGALMVIDDHINLLGTNPLVGANDDRFGPRFPDMTEAYSKRLRQLADAAAAARGLRLHHGVYAAVHGPSYETPAEIRALRAIGADAVGMSTAPETIVARHMGIEVLGLSCITNMAAGVLDRPLDHAEVMATAARVRGAFIGLLEGILERL
ncbi:MAG: purine-nucleoside phosphorylase [Acidobacteria bacterium]|nr:purine-nucleoside phosphorylase [Acidobacteriota bacterium]